MAVKERQIRNKRTIIKYRGFSITLEPSDPYRDNEWYVMVYDEEADYDFGMGSPITGKNAAKKEGLFIVNDLLERCPSRDWHNEEY